MELESTRRGRRRNRPLRFRTRGDDTRYCSLRRARRHRAAEHESRCAILLFAFSAYAMPWTRKGGRGRVGARTRAPSLSIIAARTSQMSARSTRAPSGAPLRHASPPAPWDVGSRPSPCSSAATIAAPRSAFVVEHRGRRRPAAPAAPPPARRRGPSGEQRCRTIARRASERMAASLSRRLDSTFLFSRDFRFPASQQF